MWRVVESDGVRATGFLEQIEATKEPRSGSGASLEEIFMNRTAAQVVTAGRIAGRVTILLVRSWTACAVRLGKTLDCKLYVTLEDGSPRGSGYTSELSNEP